MTEQRRLEDIYSKGGQEPRRAWNPLTRWIRTLSITQRMMIIPIVLIAGSAVTNVTALKSSDKLEHQVDGYVELTNILPQILTYSILMGEASQIGSHYLNGDTAKLAEFREHIGEIERIGLTSGNNDLQEVKAAIASLHQSKSELVRLIEQGRDRLAAGEPAAALTDEVLALMQNNIEPAAEKLSASIKQHMGDQKQMLVQERHEEAQLLWGILIGGTIVTVLLVAWSIMTVAGEIRRVEDAMDELSEASPHANYTTTMRGNMRSIAESFAKLKNFVSQAVRLKGVVEQTPEAIMLADRQQLTIDYMNSAAMKLFRSIESGLPCRADEIVGNCIDIFHKNPSHQRGMVAHEPNFPLNSQFNIAGKSIRFSASPIHDIEGNWDTIMVCWQDATEIDELARNFDANVGVLVQDLIAASSQMQGASETLSSMAEESAAQASSVSSGASEANQNVVTVASAAEELAASIAEITRQVEDAVRISGQAVDEADSTNRTVAKLSTASEEIGEVVRVITDIAEQTNLLALNASIEAARAGEAGRGFAVVAGEVKELANQTARATQKIAEQITSIQSESEGAAKAIEHIGSTIRRMNEINRAIAAATEEQNGATREIAQSVQYASDATQRVTEAIGGVSEAAVDTGRSASDVLAASGDIRNKADGLQGNVRRFLESMLTQKV